jgi:uroporphyrinogen decarboxylase
MALMQRIQLDLDAFWKENAASRGKPFRTDKPRAPLTLALDDHWLMAEMQLPSTVRYYKDPEYGAEMRRQCNDRCDAAIGRRPFGEAPATAAPLRIEQVFGCRIEIIEGGTPWLEPGVSSIEELCALLDRLEAMDDQQLRELIFSTGATIARRPLRPEGSRAVAQPGSRGPATIATSVIGTTTCLYWLVDYPGEMDRFFHVLAETLIRYHRILERQTNTEYRGYGWLDDNCALLSPPMYERFCFPVLKRIFDEFAPRPGDMRYQHSDSAMAHLLPILTRLNFTGVNFGPTVMAAEIRRHMPRTVVHGQVAPNTVRDGTLDDIVAEVKRDFAVVGHDGGLEINTAGSISAGTSLDSIRALMWAVQEHARYDR